MKTRKPKEILFKPNDFVKHKATILPKMLVLQTGTMTDMNNETSVVYLVSYITLRGDGHRAFVTQDEVELCSEWVK